jgi:hypothetical protein
VNDAVSASGALPYTLLLLLLELGVGGALVMHAVHLRGQATPGFVRATTIMVPIVLGLAFWTAFTLEGDVVEGFAVRSGPREALVWTLAALTAASVLHNLALYTDRDLWARRIGWLLSGLSLAALGLTAATLAGSPEALTVFSLGFGALALGLSAVGLALGHWYLVTPRLPARPLVEITTAFLIVVLVQAILFGVALAVSIEDPVGGRDQSLTGDPTFWLRIVIGFVLPLVFGWMAWTTARMRSMMAATGLLYLTTAAVLAAQIAARALMLDSGRPL